MDKKNQEEPNFAALFSDAKRVKHDKYVPDRKLKKVFKNKSDAQNDDKRIKASVELSDMYEAYFPPDQPLKFVTDSVDKDIVKQLKLGLIPPDIELDLHGFTVQEAKNELIAALFEAKKRSYPCINVITGHGNGVLKQKMPHYLAQHPDVAAFIQAPKQYSGKAGLLVLVKIDFRELKL